MQKPDNTYQGNGFDPANPATSSAYPVDRGVLSESEPAGPERDESPADDTAGVSDPGASNKTEMSRTAGQPDTWPQRPDIPVPRAQTKPGGPNLLGRIPD